MRRQVAAFCCQLPVEGFWLPDSAFGALREVETSFLFINRFRLAVSVRRSVRFSYKQSRAADASQTNDIIWYSNSSTNKILIWKENEIEIQFQLPAAGWLTDWLTVASPSKYANNAKCFPLTDIMMVFSPISPRHYIIRAAWHAYYFW